MLRKNVILRLWCKKVLWTAESSFFCRIVIFCRRSTENMAIARRNSSTLSSTRRKSLRSRHEDEEIVELGAPKRRIVYTPRADLQILMTGVRPHKVTLSADETTSAILARLGKAMKKPGIDRQCVFKSTAGKKVYAYSIYSKEPTLMIREDAAGTRTIGRLVSGRFRVSKSASVL